MWPRLSYLSSNFSINYHLQDHWAVLRQQTWALLKDTLIVITKGQNLLLMSNFHMGNWTVAPSPASLCWLLFVPCRTSFFKGLLAKELYQMSFGDPRKWYQPAGMWIKGVEPNPPRTSHVWDMTPLYKSHLASSPLPLFTLSSLFLFFVIVPTHLFIVNILLDAIEV